MFYRATCALECLCTYVEGHIGGERACVCFEQNGTRMWQRTTQTRENVYTVKKERERERERDYNKFLSEREREEHTNPRKTSEKSSKLET